MTGETRTALLLGLGIITAFGVVLHYCTGTAGQSQAVANEFTGHSLTPAVSDIADREGPAARSSSGARRLTRTPGRAGPRLAGRPRSYTIQPNDSLIGIARKMYGPDGDKLYKLIYHANRNALPDEATLRVGQVLVIPDGRGPQRPGGAGAYLARGEAQ